MNRITEYLLPPIGVQAMASALAINKEQILDIFFGIYDRHAMVSSLSTATAYLSIYNIEWFPFT